jgi:hypothetical protein
MSSVDAAADEVLRIKRRVKEVLKVGIFVDMLHLGQSGHSIFYGNFFEQV